MIFVGTCSWAEKTLVRSKVFYPKEAGTAEGRLRFYASKFTTVEVDSSYYAMPSRRNAELWSERTPEGFVFHVKAYGALTGHGVDKKTVPRDLDVSSLGTGKGGKGGKVYIKDRGLVTAIGEKFVDALEPLRSTDRLGLILMQYPPWLRYSPKALKWVTRAPELLKGLEVAVEFRHGSWMTDKVRPIVLDALREHGITHVAADEPQYGNQATVPFVPGLTTQTAYFRFHGRNKNTWLKKGIQTWERFNYLYNTQELKTLAGAAAEVAEDADQAYLMFNNHFEGNAVENALEMKEILSGQDIAVE
jgi:uncharacterized protein YecE (DUF72 family)